MEEEIFEEPRPLKRRRRAKEGTIQESMEFSEYKARLMERAVVRDEERKDRKERELKSLEIATATLEVTKKLLEKTDVHSAALVKLLEK